MIKKYFSVKSFLVAIVLCAAVSFGGYFFFNLNKNINKKIIVPDFSNMTQLDAMEWCDTLKKDPCAFSNIYSDEVEEGKIIEQSIYPGLELEGNIVFKISLGVDVESSIPKVGDTTTKDDIEEWKNEKNIKNNIEYIEEYSDTIARGKVIKIDSDKPNEKGTIKVYVSKGTNIPKSGKIVVTDKMFVGLSLKQFEDKAEELGLIPNYKDAHDDFSKEIPKGNIIWHGTGTYKKGEKIGYAISHGINHSAVEIIENEYVGKTLKQFNSSLLALTKNGLKPVHQKDKDAYSETVSKGRIVWHSFGMFEDENEVSYGLSLGKESDDPNIITIEADEYVGFTFADFKKIITKYGLKYEHSDKHLDEYSETYPENTIIWHGTGTYKKGETIHYSLSKGVKASETATTIYSGQYVGKIESVFIETIESLGLVAYHNEEWDAFSESVSAGKIIKNGAGSYEKGEKVSYGLSLGLMIKVQSFKNSTVDEFNAYLASHGLLIGDKKEEYSTTVAAGCIIKNDTGYVIPGSAINYTVSLGPSDDMGYIKPVGEYNYCNDFNSTFVFLSNGEFKNFTNVIYKAVSGDGNSAGIIKSISVDGVESYTPGKYPFDVPIVITIYQN